MAFSQVPSFNAGAQPVNLTEHTLYLPPDIVSGDLLLFFGLSDGAPTITLPEGWTELFQVASGIAVKLGAWYRIADGGEGASITVTTSDAEMFATTSFRITGYLGTPEASTATGNNTNPQPPSLTPSWGAKDTLWFACQGNDTNRTIVSYPTNYTNGYSALANDIEGCNLGTARREFNIATEDPDGFYISEADEWVTATVAIQPAEAAEADVGGASFAQAAMALLT